MALRTAFLCIACFMSGCSMYDAAQLLDRGCDTAQGPPARCDRMSKAEYEAARSKARQSIKESASKDVRKVEDIEEVEPARPPRKTEAN